MLHVPFAPFSYTDPFYAMAPYSSDRSSCSSLGWDSSQYYLAKLAVVPGHTGTTAPDDTTAAPLFFLFAPERPEPRGHLCHPNQFLPTGRNRLCCRSGFTLAPDKESTKAQSSFPVVKQWGLRNYLSILTDRFSRSRNPGPPILPEYPVFYKRLLVCMTP